MDETLISELLSNGILVFLVAGGALFFAWRVWPYMVERDTEERLRKHEQSIRSMDIETCMATALSEMVKHLENPIRIQIEPND